MKSYIFKIIISSFIFLFLLPAVLPAAEFTFAANIHTGYGDIGAEENNLEFKADILPRFFTLIGRNSEFLMTAGLSFDSNIDSFCVPELLQTEFTFRFGSSGFRFGRFYYSDPLSFIFEGLFDGAEFFNISRRGILNIGVWYTGYLYKNNTIIDMTSDEQIRISEQIDFDNFFNTYFASKRLIASIGWEHPSFGEFMHLNTALIGQFDFTGNTDQVNSQYFIAKFRIPINNFTIEFGGSFGNVMQNFGASDELFNPAFAGEAGFLWLFPGEYNSRLSFSGKVAGGKIDDFCEAFIPVTSKYYGYILKHKMSGLSVLMLNYSIRINRFLGTSITGSYFVRNDLGTFAGYPLFTDNNSEGYFLGPEFSAKLIWSPVSDLQFNFGGGVFIPSLGDAEPGQIIKWRVDFTSTFSL